MLPSCHCLHSLDDIFMWNGLSIWRICPPEAVNRSSLESSALMFVLTLLLGDMLHIARYGLQGSKLCLLCQG